MSEKCNVPVIHNTDELQLYLQPIYVIENYTVDKESYEKFYDTKPAFDGFKEFIKYCRENRI